MVLEIARKNQGKTLVVVSNGPGGNADLDPNDPDYHLAAIYQTPVSTLYHAGDEAYQIYILKPSSSL